MQFSIKWLKYTYLFTDNFVLSLVNVFLTSLLLKAKMVFSFTSESWIWLFCLNALCGSASPVLMATGLVSGKWLIPIHTESTALNRSPRNLSRVITSTTTTAVPNLVQIRLRGRGFCGNRWNITNNFNFISYGNSPTIPFLLHQRKLLFWKKCIALILLFYSHYLVACIVLLLLLVVCIMCCRRNCRTNRLENWFGIHLPCLWTWDLSHIISVLFYVFYFCIAVSCVYYCLYNCMSGCHLA